MRRGSEQRTAGEAGVGASAYRRGSPGVGCNVVGGGAHRQHAAACQLRVTAKAVHASDNLVQLGKKREHIASDAV